MEDDEYGIAAFENPAPTKDTSHYLDVTSSGKVRKAPKRKLRYRPEIDVSGDRYKGKRATRAELELDPASLGLFDDGNEDNEADDYALSHGIVSEDDDDGDTDLMDLDNESASHDVSTARLNRQNEEDEEERALIRRLANSKKVDQRRAAAVRKQKSVYDSLVNMRIRLEPLLSLARTFPSKEQRTGSNEWDSSETLTEAMQAAQSSIQSLITHSESAWETTWPMPVLEDSDDEIDEGDNMDSESAKNIKKKSISVDKENSFEEWRDAVLNQWGRKVNDATGIVPKGGFKAFDTSVSAQMKGALSSGKQLERTRRVKESLSLLGTDTELYSGSSEMQFDDGEFYRTLLREIIETGDAPGGALRYAQLSKQGKVKRKRTFPSKTRINYEVHEKMVGFLPSVPQPDPGPVDEIIANLFGVYRKIQS